MEAYAAEVLLIPESMLTPTGSALFPEDTGLIPDRCCLGLIHAPKIRSNWVKNKTESRVSPEQSHSSGRGSYLAGAVFPGPREATVKRGKWGKRCRWATMVRPVGGFGMEGGENLSERFTCF